MHLVYASKEVLKIRLRCNPSTKIQKNKMLKGGVSFVFEINLRDIFLGYGKISLHNKLLLFDMKSTNDM